MGLITNGFLIGARKSAGGINFLRLKGQQVFRNKPQIAADYVPTGAQVLQRTLQAALTKAIQADADIMMLVQGGWDRHDVKRTNMNEFQREAARLFTREADGTLSLIADKESRMAAADTAGYAEYVREAMGTGRMPFTKSTFAFPAEAVAFNGSSATLSESGMAAVKQRLGAKYSQDFVNDIAFDLVTVDADGAVSIVPFATGTATVVVGQLYAVRASATRGGNVYRYQISTAINA